MNANNQANWNEKIRLVDFLQKLKFIYQRKNKE